jgi:hypothetical protein
MDTSISNQIKEGQVWAYTKGKYGIERRNYLMEAKGYDEQFSILVKIVTKNKHNVVLCVTKIDNNPKWGVGLWEEFVDSFKNLVNNYILVKDLPEELPEHVGTTCIMCKRDYPYAEPAFCFECWGCKNGF